MLECPICGTEFPRKGRRNYCADPCRDIAKKRHKDNQMADQRERSKVCKELRKGDYIDPKWLERGTISRDSGRCGTDV